MNQRGPGRHGSRWLDQEKAGNLPAFSMCEARSDLQAAVVTASFAIDADRAGGGPGERHQFPRRRSTEEILRRPSQNASRRSYAASPIVRQFKICDGHPPFAHFKNHRGYRYMGTIRSFVLLAALLASAAAVGQEAVAPEAPSEAATGTLVVTANAFTSEKELPKKVAKQLKNGGLEWGIRDNLLVFTMVNKQFVDFPINHMTRYGQSEQLTLPAGDYRVTGIGMEMTAGFNVQKILDRGAFVNDDAVTFRIEPGSVTTLSINPVIKRDNALMVDFWMPTLMVRVSNGTDAGEEVAINTRGDKSIAWPQYTGPLKFIAK